MKNIITVTRLNDNAHRIYELPEEYTIDKGALVLVETRFDTVVYGIATTPSTVMEDEAVKIVRAALGMNPDGDFLKVKAVYTDAVVIEYPGKDEAEDE